jgi:hypothetical protein
MDATTKKLNDFLSDHFSFGRCQQCAKKAANHRIMPRKAMSSIILLSGGGN